MAQVSQKKYYDIQHSRNFKFTKNDTVIKFLPRNSQRKGGKLEDKFSGPYVNDEITDLGIARLCTRKGKVLKKGVPIKQLQKYNKKDDEGNYSNTSSDTENEDQQRKRRRVSSHSESSKSVTPTEEDQPSVKQSVTQDTINDKESVTPVKEDHPSVKQSVTQNMINNKELFARTPTSTKHNKRKKIIITPMKSPITQIKGGIKKLQPQKRKFLFQNFTDKKDNAGTEIELCDTLPDLDDENEDKVCVELCDTPDTLPDLHVQSNQQTNGHKTQKTVSQPEIQEMGFYEGDPVLFFPNNKQHTKKYMPIFRSF